MAAELKFHVWIWSVSKLLTYHAAYCIFNLRSALVESVLGVFWLQIQCGL
jgi:hypothetical protein